jgi:hypothetical protein
VSWKYVIFFLIFQGLAAKSLSSISEETELGLLNDVGIKTMRILGYGLDSFGIKR